MNKREMVSSWIRKVRQRSSSLFPSYMIVLTVFIMLAALAFNRAKLSSTYADCVQTSPTVIGGTMTPSPTDTATPSSALSSSPSSVSTPGTKQPTPSATPGTEQPTPSATPCQ